MHVFGMHLIIVYLIFLETNQRPRAIGVESDDGYQITIPQFVPQDIYLELVYNYLAIIIAILLYFRKRSMNSKQMVNNNNFKAADNYVQYKYGEDEDFRLVPDWESWSMTLCPSTAPTTTTTTTTSTTTTTATKLPCPDNFCNTNPWPCNGSFCTRNMECDKARSSLFIIFYLYS